MPEHTSEKAEVKMYSDLKSPCVYLAFDPGMALGPKLKTACASTIRFREVGGIIGWDSHDRAV